MAEEEKGFKCPMCEVTFSTKEEFEKHMKEHKK